MRGMVVRGPICRARRRASVPVLATKSCAICQFRCWLRSRAQVPGGGVERRQAVGVLLPPRCRCQCLHSTSQTVPYSLSDPQPATSGRLDPICQELKNSDESGGKGGGDQNASTYAVNLESSHFRARKRAERSEGGRQSGAGLELSRAPLRTALSPASASRWALLRRSGDTQTMLYHSRRGRYCPEPALSHFPAASRTKRAANGGDRLHSSVTPLSHALTPGHASTLVTSLSHAGN